MADKHAYTILRAKLKALEAARDRAIQEADNHAVYTLSRAIRDTREDIQKALRGR